MEYRDYNDHELISYIKEDHEEASEIMFQKYEPFIVATAKKMMGYAKYSGLELNDFIQEGMLAFNIALQEYDMEKDNLFYTFAKRCVENKMISLVMASRRQKHKVLNESVSIEIATEDGETKMFDVILEDNRSNPEELLLNNEREKEIIEIANQNLTPFEAQVFELKLNSFTYKEIADLLDKDPKSVDNAIQRIKMKLKEKI